MHNSPADQFPYQSAISDTSHAKIYWICRSCRAEWIGAAREHWTFCHRRAFSAGRSTPGFGRRIVNTALRSYIEVSLPRYPFTRSWGTGGGALAYFFFRIHSMRAGAPGPADRCPALALFSGPAPPALRFLRPLATSGPPTWPHAAASFIPSMSRLHSLYRDSGTPNGRGHGLQARVDAPLRFADGERW